MKNISIAQFGGWEEFDETSEELTLRVQVYDVNQDPEKVVRAVKEFYKCEVVVFRCFLEKDNLDLRLQLVVKNHLPKPEVSQNELRKHLESAL